MQWGKSPWGRVERFPHEFVVCPYRDPELSWQSWQRRKTGDEELFVFSWVVLQNAIDDFNPIVVPIGMPGTQQALDRIDTNIVYEGEWENKGSGDEKWPGLSAPAHKEVYDLPIVKSFQ